MRDKQTARAVAARLVAGVMQDRVTLSDQLARGALAALAPADRARAQRLALMTLRRVGPVDRVLKPLLRKEPPALVRAILRVAVAEMLAEGAEPHGVVSEAVASVRAGGRKLEGFTGLVNAVLRRASETPPGAFGALAPQELPAWLRGRLMSAWGKAATQAMEAAHAAGAPLDLTPRDGDAAALAVRLGATALPTGSVRLSARAQVSDLPGYAAGEWWVQDAAAALPARALAVRPGERVLDLCAAPGGKTLQLAAAGASVTALDLSAQRMERLHQNLARCGLSAETVVADALGWQPGAPFDAILLDAPCSATGTIRRHPDLPFVRDPAGLKEIVALQAALLDRALGFLTSGGRLVYSTCSLLPEEGERQVTAALARHPGLRVEPLDLPGTEPGWASPEGGLRLRPDYWPGLGGMDGFYLAVLRPSG
ncbi:RsmB/NOP family class I SAM-dependent RNA methyltransferase [Albidovulum sediminicola]|uniref:Methyltransferase domain-containing protein n=1 Tax=Albidovulum sediminicola TaxID=2984331 RepID=A0ABT2Z6B8_9RHOB|nr:transcription antitermination factor NusB [Defluviimonas sp. WL0075]MCV2866683.1 methyltransferase domain-containing protein [Defluviimonas sp. WL0075]